MGEARPFEPEKLVVAVLISKANLSLPGCWERIRERLIETFGDIDYTSPPLPFGFTGYYDRELGAPLVRLFVAFRKLVDPAGLASIKSASNALEDDLRVSAEGPADGKAAGRNRAAGPRSVNLDPGLLSLSRFVLASTKDSSHRIPLADGIFAEITLQYRRPSFQPVPWTYPDYRSEEAREILTEIRTRLRTQLRNRRSRDACGAEGEDPAATGSPPR